jgi:branched-subunit amino acid transport protein
MNAFAVLLLAGIAMFGLRSSMVHVLYKLQLSDSWLRVIAAVVPAGLAASAAASLAGRAGAYSLAHVLAAAVTLVVGCRRALPTAVGAGMAVNLAVTLLDW